MSTFPDIQSNRLKENDYFHNFCDLHEGLDLQRAQIESSRCYYCYDAPCIEACPTQINIPEFIRKISTGNVKGAAVEILKENIMGGTCSRACPVEILCQAACVRNSSEDKPVEIGLLQRYATDFLFASKEQPFSRAPSTGKMIAVVGAGPAGLAAAHRLALLGHQVVIFESKSKPGGLNEYGLAAYKMVDNFAQKEVQFILSIGGIEIKYGQTLGDEITLEKLCHEFDAVFLGIGLSGVKSLNIPGEDLPGVINAVDFIAEIRQAPVLSQLPVGRRVIVIGGGNTAIDVAIQTKRLGSESVTLVYRRSQDQMTATRYEQELAQKNGIMIQTWAQPRKFNGNSQGVTGVEFEYTEISPENQFRGKGEFFTLEADTVFKAIGQVFNPPISDSGFSRLKIEKQRIQVDENRRTSLQKVFAGGDCIQLGNDLTVDAVQDGKIAALSIHRQLKGECKNG
jgi:dihydropyrimidine dehydrogenase (NAD+) subunit PreT